MSSDEVEAHRFGVEGGMNTNEDAVEDEVEGHIAYDEDADDDDFDD
jgi:hypothetical protein